jgi:hypothetical protein
MANEVFVSGLTFILCLVLLWGFRVLPKENWQILAALPRDKNPDNSWEGLNLTYYGFFIACAYALGATLFFIFLGALRVPVPVSFLVMALMAGVCLPSAKVVAAVVEKKPNTWTVGGASFVGLVLSPWIVYGTDRIFGPRLGVDLAVLPVLAAISIAYAYGESLGRLACISFGCCYGKPLSRCHPLMRRLFRKNHFVFLGKTKKIAYSDGFDGEPVIPIQALTSVIYVTAALLGTFLFLSGQFGPAFLVTLLTTQLWRLASEFFRADYRGEKRFSAYQVMSILGVGYGLLVYGTFGYFHGPEPDILAGLASLWDPAFLIFIQGLWLSLFLFTGRSRVTGSTISVRVIEERT